jgi:hypothetical protein
LSAFQADVLAAIGGTADEALGNIRAGLIAVGERNALQAALKTQSEQSTQKEFRTELKGALKEGRMTLGELRAVIPTLMEDEEQKKALAAIEKLDAPPAPDAPKEQHKSYRSELLDAVCAGSIGVKRMPSVRAFVNARPAAEKLPAAAAEPTLSGENGAVVRREGEVQLKKLGATDAQLKEFGAKYGIGADVESEMASVNTVEEAIAIRQRTAAATKK